eukprot:scaffold166772_cov29-Tisochrysis_lutea.AAC.3
MKPVHAGGQFSTSASRAFSAASCTAIDLRRPVASFIPEAGVSNGMSMASPRAASMRIRRFMALSVSRLMSV